MKKILNNFYLKIILFCLLLLSIFLIDDIKYMRYASIIIFFASCVHILRDYYLKSENNQKKFN